MEGKSEDPEGSVVSSEQKAGRETLKLRLRSARRHAPASFAFLFRIRAECNKVTRVFGFL